MTTIDFRATDVPVVEHALECLERGWTQGAFARQADGSHAVVHDGDAGYFEACSWCAQGALREGAFKVYGSIDGVGYLKGDVTSAKASNIANRIADMLQVEWLAAWNDEPRRTQADVVDAFKAYLAHCKSSRDYLERLAADPIEGTFLTE